MGYQNDYFRKGWWFLIDMWSTFGVLQKKSLQHISTQVKAESSDVPLQLLIDTFDEFGNMLPQGNNKGLQYIH